MSVPPLSVLMPVHNAVQTVARALASLWAQQAAAAAPLPAFEVLVVDDGSTDGTAGLLDEMARREPRLHVLHRAHAGIAAALNAGLEAARGSFLARMDADDVAHPHRLALQWAHLKAQPHVDVSASCVAFGGDAVSAGGFAHFVQWQNSVLTAEDIARNRFRDTPLCHPSVMLRREAVTRWGGYADGDFAEDWELWLRWLDGGACMEKLPQTLLTWNDPPTRATRTDSRYRDAANNCLRSRWLARELWHSAPPAARDAAGRPQVWVVGAGKVPRKRLAPLWAEGIVCAAYIDIDPHKVGNVVGGVPVLGRTALPPAGHCVILNALTAHGAAEEAAHWLGTAGYSPEDWWLV